jgi:hypothetical protein
MNIFNDEQSKKEEINLLPKIIEKFNINISLTKNMDRFDYENKDFLIELKTRNNESNKYPTTIISTSKINYGLKIKKNMIFIFKFIDCIKYIEYDEKTFKNYENKYFKSRTDRGKDEYNYYTFIPIKDLINF